MENEKLLTWLDEQIDLAEDVTPTKAELDALIDWYERFRPEAGNQIRVFIKRKSALRFATPHERGGLLFYRGREIVTRDVWASEA